MPAGYASGFNNAFIWLTDGNGRMAGTVGASIAQGNTVQPYYMKEVIDTTFSYQEVVELDLRGGDAVQGTEEFGNSKLQAFDITVSAVDSAVMDFITGSGTDTTAAKYTYASVNPAKTDLPYCGIAMVQRFQPKDTATDGDRLFHTVIIPRATIRPRLGGYSYQAESNMTYHVTPTFTTLLPNGQSFADSGLTLQDNKADHISLFTQYMPWYVGWLSDGANPGTVVASYRPVNATTTPLASAYVVQYNNGTAGTVVSAATTHGTIVTQDAGAAGQMFVVQMMTEYVAA